MLGDRGWGFGSSGTRDRSCMIPLQSIMNRRSPIKVLQQQRGKTSILASGADFLGLNVKLSMVVGVSEKLCGESSKRLSTTSLKQWNNNIVKGRRAGSKKSYYATLLVIIYL